MTRLAALALLLPLAACTTWPDAGYAPAAPIAPAASTASMTWPTDPFIVTAPGPAGNMTPYHVMPTPGGGAVVQPGVLPPLRRYNTNGSYVPVTP